jgi:hypothetical protein
VDPRAGLDDVEKRKFLNLPGLELRPIGRPARSLSPYGLRVYLINSTVYNICTDGIPCSHYSRKQNVASIMRLTEHNKVINTETKGGTKEIYERTEQTTHKWNKEINEHKKQ